MKNSPKEFSLRLNRAAMALSGQSRIIFALFIIVFFSAATASVRLDLGPEKLPLILIGVGVLGGLVISGLLLKRQLPDPGEITYRNGTLTFPPALFADRQTKHLNVSDIVAAEIRFIKNNARTVLLTGHQPDQKLILTDRSGHKCAVSSLQTDIKPLVELLQARGIDTPNKTAQVIGKIFLVYIIIALVAGLILASGLAKQLLSLLS